MFSTLRGSIDALDGGMIEMVLDPDLNKTRDIWHICIEVPSIRLPRLWPCLGLSVDIVGIGSVTALKIQHLHNYQSSFPNCLNK